MIDFEKIKKANESIRTTDIKGKDYAEVNQRIKAFRMCYPNGVITTDIISLENGVVLMKATIQNEHGAVIGTGYAQEKENSTFINKTSYIENCETSAVGRALGMCGFGIDTSVASYEEVMNAMENQKEEPKPTPKQAPKKEAAKQQTPAPQTPQVDYRQLVINHCGKSGVDMNVIAKAYGLNGKSTQEDFKKAYELMTKPDQ